MARRTGSHGRGKPSIESALKGLDRTADRLLRSNKECLIPESEAIGHSQMNNCHVIGEQHLSLIANERGEVLCWPTSIRSMQSLCDFIARWSAQENSDGRYLEREMVRWQSAYQESAWHRATSKIREFTPFLRIAATGIVGPQDCPVTMTILPTADGKCLLIATVLENESKIPTLTQWRRRKAARPVGLEWVKSLTKSSPVEWLPKLSRQCEFLCLAPHDYYNDEFVTRNERREIEQAIAKKVNTLGAS